jgi:2-amino-4-hydroxy-6-hydroxymethyldihydropteridine diphosphokinase
MDIILSFGSNLGEKEKTIKEAYKQVEDLIGKMTLCSSLIETKAWGFESKEMFLNSVAVFNTKKTPTECLSIIHNIEKSLGRVRTEDQVGYSSRTIDIDILFYDSLVLETSSLTIPHPLLTKREFVLTPLKQILPDFIHPILKQKIRDIKIE